MFGFKILNPKQNLNLNAKIIKKCHPEAYKAEGSKTKILRGACPEMLVSPLARVAQGNLLPNTRSLRLSMIVFITLELKN